jgi:hypothetical protein
MIGPVTLGQSGQLGQDFRPVSMAIKTINPNKSGRTGQGY